MAEGEPNPAETVRAEGFELPPAPTRPEPTVPLVRTVTIRVPARHNEKLRQVIDRVNQDDELYAYWVCANVNAVDRLKMSDHGPVHVQIVANVALKLLRLLTAAGITPSTVRNYGLSVDDAEVVVVLAALLHDVGMAVHRDDHEQFSLFLAAPKVRELLDGIYPPPTRTILGAEVLHAIIAHRADGRPLTLEAGVVRVADALDMAQGRSRIAFEAGAINIHSVSAAAIDRVEVTAGEQRPIRIAVTMLNSAGLFQLDHLLKEKLRNSGLEPYVEVSATVQGETEKKLLEVFRLP